MQAKESRDLANFLIKPSQDELSNLLAKIYDLQIDTVSKEKELKIYTQILLEKLKDK